MFTSYQTYALPEETPRRPPVSSEIASTTAVIPSSSHPSNSPTSYPAAGKPSRESGTIAPSVSQRSGGTDRSASSPHPERPRVSAPGQLTTTTTTTTSSSPPSAPTAHGWNNRYSIVRSANQAIRSASSSSSKTGDGSIGASPHLGESPQQRTPLPSAHSEPKVTRPLLASGGGTAGRHTEPDLAAVPGADTDATRRMSFPTLSGPPSGLNGSQNGRVLGRGGAGAQTVAKLSSRVGLRSRSRPTTPADAAVEGGNPPPAFGALSALADVANGRQQRPSLKKLKSRSRPGTSESLPEGVAEASGSFPGKFSRLSSDASSAAPKVEEIPPCPDWASFSLPAPDDPSIQGQPLPVRLGLVPPQQRGDSKRRQGPFGTQVVDGYYLHTPPPRSRRRSFSRGSLASSSTAVYGSAPGSASTSTAQVFSQSQTSLSLTSSRHGDEPVAPRPPLARSSTDQTSHSSSDTTIASSVTAGRSTGKTGSSSRKFSEPSYPSPEASAGLSDLRNEQSSSAVRDKEEWNLDDYFTVKHKRVSSGGRRQVRYHAYPRERVPYFLSHDNHALSSELYAHHLAFESLSYRHSIIPWGPEKPARILDIGTGTGAWCTDAARDWTMSEFVGLDCVPIQTPIDAAVDSDLASRVSWMVANFLEGLPFPNHCFDYVHVRALGATSISEDQWPSFLAEIMRVLKPGGHLEVLEFNWGFTGNLRHVTLEELTEGFKVTRNSGSPAAGTGESPLSPSVPSNQPKGSSSRLYAPLEEAFDRVMTRRFINPRILTLIPGNLTTQDFRQIRAGNPRRVPLTAKESDFLLLTQVASAQAAKACASPKMAEPEPVPNAQDPSAWAKAYTTRAQVGEPLANSGFFVAPANLGLFRSLCILSHADKVACARDLVWDEAEEEEAALLSHSVGPQGGGRGTEGSACWAHPWRQRRDFDVCMDAYQRDMSDWADIGALVKDRLGWKSGEDLESVAERKMGEKQRKLNIGAAAMAGAQSVRPGLVNGQEGSTGGALSASSSLEADSAILAAVDTDRDGIDSPEPSPMGLGFQVSQSTSGDGTGAVSASNSETNVSCPPATSGSPRGDVQVDLHAVSLFDESGANQDDRTQDARSGRSASFRSGQAGPSPAPSASSSPMRKDGQRIVPDEAAAAASRPTSSTTPSSPSPMDGSPAGTLSSQPRSQSDVSAGPMYIGLLGIMETTGYSAATPAIPTQ
ncbi:unnamed protein product [Parajaminaea phylloscopi]